jgi:glycosyltransferase involved in cell wall biosynthesis
MKLALLNDGIYDYAFRGSRSSWATGGAERQQWMLARAMAAAGHMVVVGARSPDLAPGAYRECDGVRFVGIGREHIFRAWHRFFATERPDWWFWQCASHLFGFGVAIAHRSGVNVMFGTGFDRDVRVREALYHRPRWWPVYAFGLARAERIALQHGGQRTGLPRRWNRKAFVVPNIIECSPTALAHAKRPPTVAWIAALRVQKRPDRLIAIAKRLPQVRFVVCGGPSTYMTPAGYSDRAIEQLRELPNVDYRGQVSPEDAVRVVSEAAVLLSTSQEEGFPQTFLEGWSFGTPVVTIGIDPDRVIQDGSLGVVCADPEAAAAAVGGLVSDVGQRERMSRNVREYVARAHSPAAAVQAFERAVVGSVANTPVNAPSAPAEA